VAVKDDDKARSTGSAVKPSVAPGPHGEHESAKAPGASDPQALRSRVATTQEEIDERARQVARSAADTIPASRAREEAQAAERRSQASDPEQNAVEKELAEILYGVADRHEASAAATAERTKLLNRSTATQPTTGAASGPIGEPLSDKVRRGTVVVYHTPGAVLDTTGLVIRVWPPVKADPDDPKSKSNRWRADLVLFPFQGTPASIEGVAQGSGVGQFELADEVDLDDVGMATGENEPPAPFRHEIH
jgi:hypothetical protein